MDKKTDKGKTYTVQRVALMLHVFPDKVIRAIEEGKLRAIKDNGSYLIPDESMREFMKDGNPFEVRKETAGAAKKQ